MVSFNVRVQLPRSFLFTAECRLITFGKPSARKQVLHYSIKQNFYFYYFHFHDRRGRAFQLFRECWLEALDRLADV